mgnify:CR=1 FL=1
MPLPLPLLLFLLQLRRRLFLLLLLPLSLLLLRLRRLLLLVPIHGCHVLGGIQAPQPRPWPGGEARGLQHIPAWKRGRRKGR